MKNSEVCEVFVNTDKAVKTKNVFIEGRAIYSYGYHFPMALKLEDDIFILNSDKYSMTTSKQMSYLKRALINKKVIPMNTTELKELINNDVKSIKQLAIEKIKGY